MLIFENMNVPNIIIAVDGYSSTGKSTFAKAVAKELGFVYLDSGALYRGVTLFAQEQNLIRSDNTVSSLLKKELPGLDLYFNSEGKTCIGDRVVEQQIRTMKVSSQVSPVSAEAYVRAFVDDRLHAMAANGRVVMDGRDIGTTVFPKAELKIFMTASPEVRARRRFEELKAKGENPDMAEVEKNIRERDYIDSHREVSPLQRAADSFLLDNSRMTLDDELTWVRGLIQGRFTIFD